LKEIGDGIPASFSSVFEAVYCAWAIQKMLKEEEISLRICIHQGGKWFFRIMTYFVDGVNIKICNVAKPNCGPGTTVE